MGVRWSVPAWCVEILRLPLLALIGLTIGLLLAGCAMNGGGLIANKASPPGGRITCAGACS